MAGDVGAVDGGGGVEFAVNLDRVVGGRKKARLCARAPYLLAGGTCQITFSGCDSRIVPNFPQSLFVPDRHLLDLAISRLQTLACAFSLLSAPPELWTELGTRPRNASAKDSGAI